MSCHEQIKVKGAICECLNKTTSSASLLGCDWLSLDWSYLKHIHATPSIWCQRSLIAIPQCSGMNLGSSRESRLDLKWMQMPSPSFVELIQCPTLSNPKLKLSWNVLKRETSSHLSLSPKCAASILHVLKHDTGSESVVTTNSLWTRLPKLIHTPCRPRIEDLFASLSKGRSFFKLDLAHAYQQILLSDGAKELTTINTRKF